jgi:hypothetical protein
VAQSQEERAQAEEKGEVANAKEEERQLAEVTRRVARTVAPYVEPVHDKLRDSRWDSQEEEEQAQEK